MHTKQKMRDDERDTFIYVAKGNLVVQILQINLPADELGEQCLKTMLDRGILIRSIDVDDSRYCLTNVGRDDFHIRDKNRRVRVEPEKIMYLKAARCYCEIYLMGGKKLVAPVPMRAVMDYLPVDRFIRVHRSYVVNRTILNEIDGNRIILSEGEELPIGRKYRNELMRSLTIVCRRGRKR
jgi:DNA-binding LytR/AlgR family response regulator